MITNEEHDNPEEQIKRLLLSEELDLLDKLRRQCDFLGDRVQDDSSIRETIRPVIIDVLRDAGVEDHERMARVLAPLVLASMREEIRNSSDMMVDALYPITGRLVAAAVTNAFRELMETLNEKLESNFSVARFQARIKSKITGQSEAEILLQRNPPFTIEELLVIHAPTGLLIAHAGNEQGTDADGKTALIGSMLTAIISFVREAISDDQSEDLRTLSFGASQLFVQNSPGIILAVRASGTKPAAFDKALEALFNDFLSRWSPTLSEFDGSLPEDDSIAIVNDLKGRFQKLQDQKQRKFRKSSRGRTVVFLAIPLVVLVSWIGYQYFEGRRIAGIEQTAFGIIADDKELQNFDVLVRYDTPSKRLVIGGLFPELAVQERLAGAWAARRPDVPIEFQTRFLPGSEIRSLAKQLREAEISLAKLNETLNEYRSDNAGLDQSINQLTNSVNTQREELKIQQDRLTSQQDSLIGEQENLTTEITALQSEIASAKKVDPIDALRRWTQGEKILFVDGLQLKTPASADTRLQALAGLLSNAPNSVRLLVVGYSDSLGNSASNLRISSDRAAAIAERLIDLGVNPEQLMAVGRSDERPVSSVVGEGNINRRVEFEIYRSN
ncbi:MAG: OmpA family protein [Gammaproteobacteria bacterium]|nr:OmpA family protein [Gammaproteobacteria bacterium]